MLLTATGFLLAGVVGLAFWWIYGRVLLLGERRRRVAGGAGGLGSGIWLLGTVFFSCFSSGKKDGEGGDHYIKGEGCGIGAASSASGSLKEASATGGDSLSLGRKGGWLTDRIPLFRSKSAINYELLERHEV